MLLTAYRVRAGCVAPAGWQLCLWSSTGEGGRAASQRRRIFIVCWAYHTARLLLGLAAEA